MLHEPDAMADPLRSAGIWILNQEIADQPDRIEEGGSEGITGHRCLLEPVVLRDETRGEVDIEPHLRDSMDAFVEQVLDVARL